MIRLVNLVGEDSRELPDAGQGIGLFILSGVTDCPVRRQLAFAVLTRQVHGI